MVEASRDLACIFVDCDWGKKNEALSAQYKIRGYPTVIYCDPDGRPLEGLDSDAPQDVAAQMRRIAKRYPSGAVDPEAPAFAPNSGTAAREAKKVGRPLAIYFYDDSPGSVSVNLALTDETLKTLLTRFHFVKTEYRKDSPDCVKYGVDRAPTILVLDPSLPQPEAKPLARIGGSRGARELQRELEATLKASTAEAPVGEAPAKRTVLPPIDETLSDDEVDRQFIQAMITVARASLSRGDRAKAVETLEDVIKSYPKHVAARDAAKLLEQIRKP